MQLKNFLHGFDSLLKKAMKKILGHDLNNQQWLICQLPAKYGGFGLRRGKLMAGAQHVMSLQNFDYDMATHAKGWNSRDCAVEFCEKLLKECIGLDLI